MINVEAGCIPQTGLLYRCSSPAIKVAVTYRNVNLFAKVTITKSGYMLQIYLSYAELVLVLTNEVHVLSRWVGLRS